MADKSYTRTERAERIDFEDFDNVAVGGHRDALSQLISEVLLGVDGAPVILWGFDVAGASPVLTVTRGAALTGFRDRGRLHRGMVLAGGPASRTINVSSFANGTYGIYVRLAFRPSQVRGRRAWNATGSPIGEVVRLIPTRYSEDWDLALERSNPGEDWLIIGTVTVTGGVLGSPVRSVSRLFDSTRTDRRYTDADWGNATDRDETNVAGISGLVRWAKMVGRQLQDIIGGDFFGSNPTGGTTTSGARSLTQLNDEKLGRSGTQTVTGVLRPDANETRDIGTSSFRFRDLFARDLDVRDMIARSLSLSTGSEARTLISFLTTADGPLLVYLSETGTANFGPCLELVWNATWDDAGGVWERINAGDVTKLDIGGGVVGGAGGSYIRRLVHDQVLAGTFADTINPASTWSYPLKQARFSGVEFTVAVGSGNGFNPTSGLTAPGSVGGYAGANIAAANQSQAWLDIRPTDIPDGAIITSCTLVFNNPVGNGECYAALVRVPSSYNSLAAIQALRISTGSRDTLPQLNGSVQSFAITLDAAEADRTVNRLSYLYGVHFEKTHTDVSAQIVECRISYYLPRSVY